MNLTEVKPGKEYIVMEIISEDVEMKNFLFSLGCYGGEPITVVSHKKGSYVLAVKNARYNIDEDLARAILVKNE